MIYRNQRLAVPSNEDYSVAQLRMMIHEIEEMIDRKVSAKEWNNL